MCLVNILRWSAFAAFLLLSSQVCGQSWQWAVPANGYPNSPLQGTTVRDIAVDGFGNAYIIGEFIDSAQFGDFTIRTSDPSNYDVFLAKIDAAGNYVWAEGFPGAYFQEFGYSTAVDGSGNVYVLVYTLNSINIGGKTVQPLGSSFVVVAKLDPSGNGIWAKSVDGANAGPGAITVGRDGYLYVASDETLDKYTADGTLVWSRDTQTPALTSFVYRDVDADDAGNVCVTGDMSGTITIGTITLSTQGTNDHDMFVAKWDAGGNALWAKRGGRAATSGPADYGHAVGVDLNGNVYVAGEYRGIAGFDADTIDAGTAPQAIFLAKYQSNGDIDWVLGSSGVQGTTSAAFDLKVLSSGEVLLAANYANETTFDDTNFTLPHGSDDLLIMKLNANGTLIWSKRSDTASPSIACQRLALNADQTMAYIGGNFSIGGDFGPSNLTQLALTVDGFAAKLNLSQGTAVAGGSTGQLPAGFQLSQNYPNPFNSATQFAFALQRPADVQFEVLNVLGQVVARQDLGVRHPGLYSQIWDGLDGDGKTVPSGVYFYRIKAGDQWQTRKMVLLK